MNQLKAILAGLRAAATTVFYRLRTKLSELFGRIADRLDRMGS
jgi:hypothetical protein